MKRSVQLLILTAAFMIIAQTGCGRKTAEPVTKQSFYFDTVCSISVYDMEEMSEEKAGDAIEKAFELCSRYESLLSRTREDTDIYRINHAQGKAVECDPETVDVIRKGLDYSERSEGRFDITIAPVAELWDFHGDDPVLPQEEEIQNALRKVDGSSVHVEKEGDAWYLTFDHPDTMLDLGGLAKGYAADRLTEYLKSQGVTSGLVNLGGNVAAIGAKADGSPWKVGIQKPFDTGIIDKKEVTGQSVVTSGVYERCFEKDGTLYHHILDPATGYPVSNGLWGVTIISDSSLQGDALSTVCLLIGQEEAMDLIRQTDGVQAVFVDDRLQVTECE